MRLACLAALLSAVLLAGCFGGDEPAEELAALPPEPVLTGAKAHAPASTTAGTLSNVPDGGAARTRLAYANVDALAAADLPVPREDVLEHVLGRDVPVPDAGAIAVPAPADRPPAVSAITPGAASAVQSCLGETLAQTVLGPRTMGHDAALGAGLAESGDAPAGIQLRLCGAPHYIRHIHAMEHALARRFGTVSGGPGRDAVIGEREIGEREIVFATVPADAVPAQRLLALLGGEAPLRALAWR